MAPSNVNTDRIFINLTDNPAKDRDARRVRVRRAVMSDYHTRRKRSKKNRQAHAEQTIDQTRQDESAPDPDPQETRLLRLSTYNGTRSPSRNSPPSPLLTQLEPRSIALFQRKAWNNPETARSGNLVIRFLCGQTRKAAQDMSCVSFIHRQFNGAVKPADQSHNSLKICEQHLRHFEGGLITATTFWDAVHREQERIYTECDSFSKWELLSASQAVILYILQWLRMGPCLAKFSCGNIALLFTLGKVYLMLRERHLHFDPSISTAQPVGSWQDWVYRESCLRAANIYFILTIVLSMDFGLPCDWKVENMPLPATKVLWEASDGVNWTRNFSSKHDQRQSPSFRDLVSGCHSDGLSNHLWEEELDEMGLICAVAGHLL